MVSPSSKIYSSDLTTGKTYFESSKSGESYNGAKAFDDNVGTQWESVALTDEYVGVDFGTSTAISAVSILCSSINYLMRYFAVEGSDDMTNWNMIYNGEMAQSNYEQKFYFNNNLSFRYWRI
jgi:hypothetical protein